MFLQIESDKFEDGYANFLRKIRRAIQMTFQQEAENGVNRASIAAELNVDRSLISKRLSGGGNITLRTVSDLFIAMGREPLSNYEFDDSNDLNVINKDDIKKEAIGSFFEKDNDFFIHHIINKILEKSPSFHVDSESDQHSFLELSNSILGIPSINEASNIDYEDRNSNIIDAVCEEVK